MLQLLDVPAKARALLRLRVVELERTAAESTADTLAAIMRKWPVARRKVVDSRDSEPAPPPLGIVPLREQRSLVLVGTRDEIDSARYVLERTEARGRPDRDR